MVCAEHYIGICKNLGVTFSTAAVVNGNGRKPGAMADFVSMFLGSSKPQLPLNFMQPFAKKHCWS